MHTERMMPGPQVLQSSWSFSQAGLRLEVESGTGRVPAGLARHLAWALRPALYHQYPKALGTRALRWKARAASSGIALAPRYPPGPSALGQDIYLQQLLLMFQSFELPEVSTWSPSGLLPHRHGLQEQYLPTR
ncbi:hypothetical protein CB1_056579118 [Camelus ferus]|nr:hypothetical protein CB1_056579118 [Camelus ferus]